MRIYAADTNIITGKPHPDGLVPEPQRVLRVWQQGHIIHPHGLERTGTATPGVRPRKRHSGRATLNPIGRNGPFGILIETSIIDKVRFVRVSGVGGTNDSTFKTG